MPYKKLSKLTEHDLSMICSHHYACNGCPFINFICPCTSECIKNLHKSYKVYVPKKVGKDLYI